MAIAPGSSSSGGNASFGTGSAQMTGSGTNQGPTPWWQIGNNASAYNNLVGSAPAGYEYNPTTGQYQRTPQSAGTRAGQAGQAYYNAFPALSGLISGANGIGGGGGSSIGSFGAGGKGNPGINTSGLNFSTPGYASTPSTGSSNYNFNAPAQATLPGTSNSGFNFNQQSNVSTPQPGFPGGASGSSIPPIANFPQVNFANNPANVAQAQYVDPSAARAASFGAAKDSAAQTAQAAVNSLQGALASRGMTGGGYQAGQISNQLSNAANTIGQASRAEATAENQAQQTVANENFQGGIQQRGQTMSAEEAANQLQAQMAGQQYQGSITQRGQNIQNQQAVAALAQQLQLAGYQGDITQRGQNLSQQQSQNQLLGQLQEAGLQAGVTQRGQDLSLQSQQNQIASQLGLAGLQAGVTERGQDITAEEAQNQLLGQLGIAQGSQNITSQSNLAQQQLSLMALLQQRQMGGAGLLGNALNGLQNASTGYGQYNYGGGGYGY